MITEFRPMSPRDWDAVRSIYQEGIATRLATFETSVPDWKTWDSAHREDCRIVAEEDHVIVGWLRCRRCPTGPCTAA